MSPSVICERILRRKKRVHLELVGGDLLKLTHLQGSQVCFINFTGTDFFDDYSDCGDGDEVQ